MRRLAVLALAAILAAPAARAQSAKASPAAAAHAKGQRTKVIVFYDATTMEVIETIIPDSDAQADTVFSAASHPLDNGVRAAVDINDVSTHGFRAAVAKVAPGVVAADPASVSMLAPVVETALAQSAAREALQ